MDFRDTALSSNSQLRPDVSNSLCIMFAIPKELVVALLSSDAGATSPQIDKSQIDCSVTAV
jgi:hypothetical protein